MTRRWLAAILVLGACTPASSPIHHSTAFATPPAPSAASSAISARPPHAPRFADDYAAARADALARDVPLVIDLWASWCPPCLAMRAFVLTDPQLGALSFEPAWLSLDTETETEGGQAYVSAHPPCVLPTLLIFDPRDPRDDEPIFRWEGTLSAPVLATLLEAVQTTRTAGAAAPRSTNARALVEGGRALVDGDALGAVQRWEQLLAATPTGSPFHDAALAAILTAYERRDDAAASLAILRRESASRPDDLFLASEGLAAARTVGATAWREPTTETWIATIQRTVDVPSSDDVYVRTSAYRHLCALLKARGEQAAAISAGERWIAALDRFGRARDPQTRLALNPEYRKAFSLVGELSRVLEKYADSERANPGDYGPSADLARTLFDLHRFDEALQACARAEAKAMWPRKIELLELGTRIVAAQGDRAAERRALADALARIGARAAPAGWYAGMVAGMVAGMRARLDKMK